MPGTVLWFVLVVVAMVLAWFAGRYITLIQKPFRRNCLIIGVLTLLLLWSALIRHPTVALHLIPVSILARLEGIGAAPLFIFIISAGWQLASVRRQRAVMALGLCLGVAYFLQGGLWMMRPTPSNAFGRLATGYLVRQTQDYSCVPAASATALRILGLRSNEEEMAELTETREGSGATLLRALNGLDARLTDTGIEARLLEPNYTELMRLEPPMLTPLQFQSAQLHMVTIIDVRPHLVVIADPQVGIEFISKYRFEKLYRGQVIAFDGQAERVSAQEILARHPHLLDPDEQHTIGQATIPQP